MKEGASPSPSTKNFLNLSVYDTDCYGHSKHPYIKSFCGWGSGGRGFFLNPACGRNQKKARNKRRREKLSIFPNDISLLESHLQIFFAKKKEIERY